MSYQEQTTQDQTVDDDRQEKLATHNLLETAIADGHFTRFLKALGHAGMASLMNGPDLYTVLAPLDESFQIDEHQLTETVLQYFVPGAFTAAEIRVGKRLKTMGGTDIESAALRIVRPDIACTNGVLHGIEGIL